MTKRDITLTVLAATFMVVLTLTVITQQATREHMSGKIQKVEERMTQNETLLSTVTNGVSSVAQTVSQLDPKHRQVLLPVAPSLNAQVEGVGPMSEVAILRRLQTTLEALPVDKRMLVVEWAVRKWGVEPRYQSVEIKGAEAVKRGTLPVAVGSAAAVEPDEAAMDYVTTLMHNIEHEPSAVVDLEFERQWPTRHFANVRILNFMLQASGSPVRLDNTENPVTIKDRLAKLRGAA